VAQGAVVVSDVIIVVQQRTVPILAQINAAIYVVPVVAIIAATHVILHAV